MKLKCELQTVYRGGAGSGQPSRKSQGLLVLSGCAPDLLVTAYTPRNARGLRYRVSSLARVFTRHAAAGKTSLSFAEPAHDLLVSGDPVQVRAFLQRLSSAVRGELPDGRAALAAAPERVTAAQLAPPPVRLAARSSAEYVRAFPAGLQCLSACGVRLRRVEERVLRLVHLRSLDLSDNRLARVPALDRRLPALCELRLACNCLETLAPLADTPAGSPLAYLDVSGNQLTELPATLAFARRLNYLNVSDNKLAALPDCIVNMPALRVLNAANNRLAWLPAQLELMDLMEVDTHGNAGLSSAASTAPRGPPALEHLTAAVVWRRLNGELPSAAQLPLCLIELLVQFQRCRQCGLPCVAGAAGGTVTETQGPLLHPRATLVHPTGEPLPLREVTCFRCASGLRRPRHGRARNRIGIAR